jgi:formate hydrogenlyase subunit 3/multisubunit Na+/H+ antiporter MnhD subunit
MALAWVLIVLALVCSGCALGSWRRPIVSAAWVTGSSLAVALAVFAMSPAHNAFAGISYAAAIALLGALGLGGTARVVPAPKKITRYAGLSEVQPFATACALVSAVGIAAFPLLPTFVAEDLLLHGTLRESGAASVLVSGAFALNGYLAVRNFAFTFLGQNRQRESADGSTFPDLASEIVASTSERQHALRDG